MSLKPGSSIAGTGLKSRPILAGAALSHNVNQITLGIMLSKERRALAALIEFGGGIIEVANSPDGLSRCIGQA
jgi:hypothetical protein